ncbi:p21-activated protein kinase-interacting protein 1-like [Sesamum angolense]|uniref:P21-activated protein kinase-interacting protein 1-like n=1 Tax=Sesamum angolense TaxID=2727404 RepID=A0AAE2BVJ3_9LAMI|nr:p21-activated protein kinase-interacting protein 1-like [Sesamum angolense]
MVHKFIVRKRITTRTEKSTEKERGLLRLGSKGGGGGEEEDGPAKRIAEGQGRRGSRTGVGEGEAAEVEGRRGVGFGVHPLVGGAGKIVRAVHLGLQAQIPETLPFPFPRPYPLFSFPSHLSTIKAVAVAGSAAVSGGNDDTIKIYDLSSSAEIGSLHHSSSITSLSFFSPPSLSSFPRNLLAADAEGSLSIYDADPFVHLKTLKVHKKAVNSLTVHPSGKLALTVGHDDCLAMVNLGGILFTGGEDRNITAWDTASGKVAYSIEDAHAARVKGIVVLSKNNGGSEEEDPYIVASASSDGVIRVWDVRMANKGKPTPLAEANTKSRLTCLAGSSIKSLKRPRLEMLNADESRGAAAVVS